VQRKQLLELIRLISLGGVARVHDGSWLPGECILRGRLTIAG